jgi:hypothetical protein
MATRDDLGNWCLNRGYPRYTSGRYRGKYVHRVKMQRHLKRRLKKDEDVHHRDRNKKNFNLSNLQVLGKAEHGWVSSKQRWFMSNKDKREKQEWDEYFDEPKAKAAKAGG